MNLFNTIQKSIMRNGPLRLSDYFTLCSNAYYMRQKDHFNDFTTLPELSNILGILIANYINTYFELPISIFEIGGGSGKLANDLLSRCKISNYYIYDISSNMLAEQCINKKIHSVKNINFDNIKGNFIIIGNEYLDTFTSHQLIKNNNQWHEMYVDCDKDSILQYSIGSNSIYLQPDMQYSLYETSPACVSFLDCMTQIIEKNDNALCSIFIDYGYIEPSNCSTLRAYKNNQIVDPLQYPGESDITFSVNFSEIINYFNNTNYNVSINLALLKRFFPDYDYNFLLEIANGNLVLDIINNFYILTINKK